MHHRDSSVPLRLFLGLMFAGCVGAEHDDGSASAPQAGVSGTTTATADTDVPGESDGACTAPHDSSTTGAVSTSGKETGEPGPGESEGDESGSSEPGDGAETGGDESGGAETGGAGDTGESTGGEGDSGESTGDSSGDTSGSTGGEAGPSFAAEVWPIFADNCGCHTDSNGAGKLKLKMNVAYGNLVGQPSNQLPTMMLVEPGSSETSYLWHKLNNTHKSVGGKGKVMPPGGKLDMADLDVVKQWIDGGAAP